MRISLNGIVAADDDQEVYDFWHIGAFSPRTVRQALADNPEGEELVLEINSPGGSVFAGGEIYSVLRSAENVRTRAEIQSLAASAASYLCLGCGEVAISPVALMMVHMPVTCTTGDRAAHLRSVQLLDSTREAILNAYNLRSGGRADRAALRRMMNAETWLTAQEAVALGLADSVLYQEEAVPQNVMNAAGAGLRALGGGGVPDITYLRAEYRRLTAGNMDPADECPGEPETVPGNWNDWRAKARLDIECSRFL